MLVNTGQMNNMSHDRDRSGPMSRARDESDPLHQGRLSRDVTKLAVDMARNQAGSGHRRSQVHK